MSPNLYRVLVECSHPLAHAVLAVSAHSEDEARKRASEIAKGRAVAAVQFLDIGGAYLVDYEHLGDKHE
jgi:hypothetical protein